MALSSLRACKNILLIFFTLLLQDFIRLQCLKHWGKGEGGGGTFDLLFLNYPDSQ